MLKRKRTELQQDICICILKLINVFNKALSDTNKDVFGQNSCKKDFSKKRDSLTWPILLHFSDQDQKGGSLTAMIFLHNKTYI